MVRDVNKYSNNIMAQHVFLALGMQRTGVASFETSRQVLAQWWQSRWGAAEQPVVDNGAGLSRNASITASSLAQMLQNAWMSPVMPEFVASMPIVGVDGTLRRSRSKSAGAAHLKTGTLRDSPRWPAMWMAPAATAMYWWPWQPCQCASGTHGLGSIGGLGGCAVAPSQLEHFSPETVKPSSPFQGGRATAQGFFLSVVARDVAATQCR